MGLHGLLQGQLYFFLLVFYRGYSEEDKQEGFVLCLPFSEVVHGVIHSKPLMALPQQQAFLGQTASASVQKQQQAFELKYNKLLSA
jgi:hypothetical protein